KSGCKNRPCPRTRLEEGKRDIQRCRTMIVPLALFGVVSMSHSPPSALVVDQGQRVLLRLQGRFYDLSQQELQSLLGLPAGEPGLGISIDGDVLRFEFAADEQTVELSASQLQHHLAKQMTTGE